MKAGSLSLIGLALVAALMLVALIPQALKAGQGLGPAVSQLRIEPIAGNMSVAEFDALLGAEELVLKSSQLNGSVFVAEFAAKTSAHEEYLSVELTPGACGLNIKFTLHDPVWDKLDDKMSLCLPIDGEKVKPEHFGDSGFWKQVGENLNYLVKKGILTKRLYHLIEQAVQDLGFNLF